MFHAQTSSKGPSQIVLLIHGVLGVNAIKHVEEGSNIATEPSPNHKMEVSANTRIPAKHKLAIHLLVVQLLSKTAYLVTGRHGHHVRHLAVKVRPQEAEVSNINRFQEVWAAMANSRRSRFVKDQAAVLWIVFGKTGMNGQVALALVEVEQKTEIGESNWHLRMEVNCATHTTRRKSPVATRNHVPSVPVCMGFGRIGQIGNLAL